MGEVRGEKYAPGMVNSGCTLYCGVPAGEAIGVKAIWREVSHDWGVHGNVVRTLFSLLIWYLCSKIARC